MPSSAAISVFPSSSLISAMDPLALHSCACCILKSFHCTLNPKNPRKLSFSSHFFFARAPRIIKLHSTQEHALVTFAQSQTNAHDARSAAADAATQSSREESDVEGLGKSGKSRGEIFLEFAAQRSKVEMDRRKEEGSVKKARVPRIKAPKVYDPCCYGCGAVLQIVQPEAPGYVVPETYALKKKHHQLRTVLCGRCRLMAHGHMIPAVGGHGGHIKASFVSAEELRAQLAHIRLQKVLVIKLVDILDFSGSFLTRVRDLVGGNPIILVVTKVDLLPKGTDMMAVGDWVMEATLRKKLKGRDVYILGSANVGKSTFINALLKEIARKDFVAAAAQKHKPIQSAMPGTTVGIIPINAFSTGGNLIDTPGVHLHHRIQTSVEPEDLPLLAPRGRVRTQILPNSNTQERIMANPNSTETLDHFDHQEKLGASEDHITKCPSAGSYDGLEGTTLFWGGVVRLDILKASPAVKLMFFGPNTLPLVSVPTTEADIFYSRELGKSLVPPATIQEGGNWSGISSQHAVSLRFSGDNRPAGDIAISGLGWVAVHRENWMDDDVSSENKEANENIKILVHTPKPVQIFVRRSLPVGVDGSRWYKYMDLSEEQEENLPKLFCYE